MKKTLGWALLLLVALSFFGCAKGEETAPEKAQEYGELRVVTNSGFRGLILNTAEARDGYYEMIGWIGEMYAEQETSHRMHSANLAYTDYATRTRTFLCGTPGCAHNSENCTSYIRFPVALTLFTNSTGTQLFAMAAGESHEVTSEEELGRIYTMNMDGSNRREIYRLKANESFGFPTVVYADETHLFVLVEVTDDARDFGFRREIREIDLIDGRITPLLTLSDQERVVSAFGDTIVISESEAEGPFDYGQEINTPADLMPGSPLQFYGYSVTEGTTRELTGKTQGFVLADGSNLFFRRADGENTVEITRYNLVTGEEKVFSGLPSAAEKYVGMWDSFDNMVIWSYVINVDPLTDKDYQYILDCDTGEYREQTLTFETNMGGVYTRFVPILAECGDRFLVQADSIESTMTLINREGIPFVYDYTYRPVYALISKEDYWNNIPNYTYIRDTVGI